MENNTPDKLRSQFFDESEILFAIFDKDLNCVDANTAFLKTLHFTKEGIIGKNITEISPDNKSSGRNDLYREVIRTEKTLILDEVKPHPSMGNIYVRVKAFKVGDGLGTASENITDLKEAVSELETFIYKSSHDMRSPIASILGLTNIAEEGLKDIDEAKRFCKIVRQQTRRLDTILQILVATTRIREGEKIIRLLDFKEIIEDTLKSLESAEGFDKINFEKHISFNGKFYSDKLLVISLFQNLLDNAIKYKKENTPNPFINISVVNENDGVKITVADNGIGIPDHLQKDVFKMFFRATEKASGSGLGLYTVNHTLKKLGGTIQLDSKEKTGTTFTIYLPNEKAGPVEK
ncbi:MAG: GHKL domain-containing protein [Bacteroidetes bacterium]|nr:GHKL domain-containing protein [Bacteroidota bacterium]